MSTLIILASFFQLCIAQLNFEGSTGILYSPNYPDNYSNNANVVYTVTVPVGNYIHLTFLDFETENPYDFLNILQGGGDDDELVSLKNVSGEQTGTSMDISDSQSTLIFKSDLTTTYRGFAIRFDAVKAGTLFSPTNSCPSPLHASSFGIVTTPSFPYNYPNNISCSYLLLAPAAHTIILQFVAFNTEDGYDIVWIYDGSNNSFPLIGKYSGNKIPPIINSSGNALYLYFRSDLVNNFQGFSGIYNSVSGVQPVTDPSTKSKKNLLNWLKGKIGNSSN
ncbi:unnamed protein product [Caenorhabditis angaria]|uniref:CUB domain-containing protein n=1 Tax=Caenorhabditis angaria TaxID=860376 RepID=A0A9P1IYC0_9PELO|nr:unnamed protein product [Caenorhabditis angaria]